MGKDSTSKSSIPKNRVGDTNFDRIKFSEMVEQSNNIKQNNGHGKVYMYID